MSSTEASTADALYAHLPLFFLRKLCCQCLCCLLYLRDSKQHRSIADWPAGSMVHFNIARPELPAVHSPTELSRLSGSSAATCASADALLLAALGGTTHLRCAVSVGADTSPPDGHAAVTAWLLPMPQLPWAPLQQLAAAGRASPLPALMPSLHLLACEAAEDGVRPNLPAVGVADHGMHDCRLPHALAPGGGCIMTAAVSLLFLLCTFATPRASSAKR